ncbi:DUF2254 domain-containing protein [Nakamurella antarctica]|uniref:DUF2254 domain-containing protein n=1 Tax=Nakamurella antarctica TaxID=1902245 RepID=A0A3G8ZPH9_9ACTN|nr:DUF2254 domain-containing protein [Nakamurella antarctica]AZI59183.1 DUF2254 domain-containing protein [Nakamurella antarctica]
MTVQSRYIDIRDSLRTQLWPVPTVGIVLALIVGVALPELDRAVDDSLPASISAYLFGGGASAARTVLDAVASSLITVTSLTFSLTVVTLQLASGQFSPRLLRTFTRDRFVHFTLALFLATFVYALTVLRTVRSIGEEQAQFVPQLSVTLAFVLAVASVVALVLFLAHLAREIRVETMLQGVRKDAIAAVVRLLAPGEGPDDDETSDMAASFKDSDPILADKSGFLTSVDHDGLCAAASEIGAVVLIERWPGAFVVAGTPIGRSRGVPKNPKETVAAFEAALKKSLTIRNERNDTQDFTFGLRQLTDVTTKALSPGVNDPTTAIHSLGHISALLCEIARHDLRPQRWYDDDGCLRVVCLQPGFSDILDEALAQPRRYGASDPALMVRLFELLREVGWSVRTPHQREAVTGQLARLRATAAAQDFDEAERAQLGRCDVQVQQALRGLWAESS